MANPYPAEVVDANGNISAGVEINFTDTGNQPGGGGAVTTASVVGNNGGDLITNSLSFVDMTGMATTIAAVTGDILFVVFRTTYSLDTGATNMNFRAVCTTSANIIDVVAATTATTSDFRVCTLAALYTVVGGDLSGGSVAVKIQWAVGAGNLRAKNSGTTVPRLSIMNMKH